MTKSLAEFYMRSRVIGGYASECKECTKLYVKRYRIKNSDYIRRYRRLPHCVEARRIYDLEESIGSSEYPLWERARALAEGYAVRQMGYSTNGAERVLNAIKSRLKKQDKTAPY